MIGLATVLMVRAAQVLVANTSDALVVTVGFEVVATVAGLSVVSALTTIVDRNVDASM
jgi:hypothetical protein